MQQRRWWRLAIDKPLGARGRLACAEVGRDPRGRADEVVAKVACQFITELRVHRDSALDQERFDALIKWIVGRV
jgi:hypothetical protein